MAAPSDQAQSLGQPEPALPATRTSLQSVDDAGREEFIDSTKGTVSSQRLASAIFKEGPPGGDHTGRVQVQLGKAIKLRGEAIRSKHADFEGEVEGTDEWSVMVGQSSRDSTQLDRSDGRNSIGAGWKSSRYWDAVVP